MANKKALFGILNDGAGAGVGIDNANPGTTLGSAIDNTIASPAFVDSNGVLVFPMLNADGALVVSTEGAGTCFSDHAKVTGSTSFQDLGSVTTGLSVAETYCSFEIYGSSMTETCYQLVHVDDASGTPVETVIWEGFSGPGDYNIMAELDCLMVDTTGGTGDQHIKLQAKLLDATGAEISGYVGFLEKP